MSAAAFLNHSIPLGLGFESQHTVTSVCAERVYKLYNLCSVHGGEGSVHRGDTFSTLGNTMSTLGNTMSTSGGHHEYLDQGETMSTSAGGEGGCSAHRGIS